MDREPATEISRRINFMPVAGSFYRIRPFRCFFTGKWFLKIKGCTSPPFLRKYSPSFAIVKDEKMPIYKWLVNR